MARRPSRPARPARRSSPILIRAGGRRSERRARKNHRRAAGVAGGKIRSSRSAWRRSPSRAGVSLAQLRGAFASPLAILAAYFKDVDRAVLAADFSDMEEEPARERLFDVLMRRLEAHGAASRRRCARSCVRRAAMRRSRFALNALAVRSQKWMLAAAGHQRIRPARRAARAGPRAAVFLGAAHLGARRRSGSCPHHGRTRPRARPRSALCRLPRRSVLHPVAPLPAALTLAQTLRRFRGVGRGMTSALTALNPQDTRSSAGGRYCVFNRL